MLQDPIFHYHIDTSTRETGFFRIWDIIGCKKRGIKPLIPVCKAQWYLGMASGKYPKPVSLGVRTIAWRKSDIYDLIDRLSADK
ncbi:AlpA family phage regulatory protein [Methylobacter sp. Wu1]|uniref:helix-turn-helix transcriptional regulator n=1 Tax=Methylobacter sp. Wu1 TaxID=3119359 RepID=UPI002F94E73A